MGLTKRNGIWYADTYPRGGKRRRVSLGVRSRRVAEGLYAELLLHAKRGQLGLPQGRQPARGGISSHLEAYVRHLEAHGGRGGSPANATHVKDVRGALERFVEDRGLEALQQLTRHEAESWLAQEAKRAPRNKGSKRVVVSQRVLEKQANALKAWSRWLADSGRLEGHVLLGLRPVISDTEQRDRRHRRRPLTGAELEAVLAKAEPYRALIWLLMARTGLRCEEVSRLRWGDVVDLEGGAPRLMLRQSATKNKRGAPRQPLPAGVAQGLLRWREGATPLGFYKRLPQVVEAPRSSGAPVFPVVPTVHTWRRDLKAAGVPYETPAGFADRHSLRMKYGTDLINAGTPPQVVQALMRHSSIKLTLELYAFASDEQRREAVEALGGVTDV